MTVRRVKRPRDPIQLGKLIVEIATGQVEDQIEDYGGLPLIPDDQLSRILRWLVICYLGEPGGYRVTCRAY